MGYYWGGRGGCKIAPYHLARSSHSSRPALCPDGLRSRHPPLAQSRRFPATPRGAVGNGFLSLSVVSFVPHSGRSSQDGTSLVAILGRTRWAVVVRRRRCKAGPAVKRAGMESSKPTSLAPPTRIPYVHIARRVYYATAEQQVRQLTLISLGVAFSLTYIRSLSLPSSYLLFPWQDFSCFVYLHIRTRYPSILRLPTCDFLLVADNLPKVHPPCCHHLLTVY